jgi:hypothetical protein
VAIRVEELHVPVPADARIYRFPVEIVTGRAERRRAAIARRRSLARRRAATGAVIVTMSVLMLFAGGPASVAPAASGRAPRVVVVEPGQTLWSLAERYAGEGIDPRAYVDAILALNGLDGPPQAGASIRLPR